MRYQITHTTTYTYDRSVLLAPHSLRLRPRCDVAQTLRSFALEVRPNPVRMSENIELEGNAVLKLWFENEVECLTIAAASEVETYRSNPFDYLLEPWAVQIPIDYPSSLFSSLQPYLAGQLLPFASAVDPIAVQLAQDLYQAVRGNTIAFLTELNQHIYTTCKYTIRETGDPLPASVTWQQQTGSCRDFAVLFVEVCRAIGLAARFVSGYQEGDPDQDRYLHAWAEVYLPGAGWRGYDPTQGLAVGDRHVALVASRSAQQTTPILGTIQTGAVQSDMQYRLTIQPLS